MLRLLCGASDLPIEKLPKECTSFNYMFLKVENNSITDQGEESASIKGNCYTYNKT